MVWGIKTEIVNTVMATVTFTLIVHALLKYIIKMAFIAASAKFPFLKMKILKRNERREQTSLFWSLCAVQQKLSSTISTIQYNIHDIFSSSKMSALAVTETEDSHFLSRHGAFYQVWVQIGSKPARRDQPGLKSLDGDFSERRRECDVQTQRYL